VNIYSRVLLDAQLLRIKRRGEMPEKINRSVEIRKVTEKYEQRWVRNDDRDREDVRNAIYRFDKTLL